MKMVFGIMIIVGAVILIATIIGLALAVVVSFVLDTV